MLCRANYVAFSFAVKNINTNLARGKPTKMSSTHSPRYTSDKAVDGNKDIRMGRQHCSHTKDGARERAWWQVDLEAAYWIRKVIITNRGEKSGECINRTCWTELNHVLTHACIPYNVRKYVQKCTYVHACTDSFTYQGECVFTTNYDYHAYIYPGVIRYLRYVYL